MVKHAPIPRLLTLGQVGEALGVGPRTVGRLVHSDPPKLAVSAFINGRPRVAAEDLAAFVEAETKRGPRETN